MADEHELARELENDTTDAAKPLVGKIEFGGTGQPEKIDELLDKIKVAPKPRGDDIDGPAHYKGYDVLEIINRYNLGFELGNVIKYILRAENKGKYLGDLKKAQFYLNWFIRRVEEG